MKTINLEIGSPEWQSAFSASKAPAMLGLSEYQSRSDLIRQMATGIGKEIDAATQARFDAGHASEAVTRAWAEKFIGEELYVLTGETVVDGLRLVASFDGITMDESICWENKLFNADFAEQVRNGIAPDTHWPQMEHQLIVSGGSKCLFTISDGAENIVPMWYESDPKRRAQVLAGWKQFAEDVANYQHVEHAERPSAEVSIELPTLYVHAQGEITQHNMEAYGQALAVKLQEVRSIVLTTDQDFSNAKAAAAMFRDQCKKLKLTKEAMLSQTVSIGEAARMMDTWHEDLRVTALQLEKDVEREDAAKKAKIMTGAKEKFVAYVAALNDRIGGRWMPAMTPDFAGAMKSKRTYASMQDAVDACMAQAKIEASAIAERIEMNRKCIDDTWLFLFADFAQICTKDQEDFARLYGQRIQQENERAAAKLEAERARIRAEEQAKAEREAQAKAQAEADRIRAEERDKAQVEQDARDAETARQRLIEQERQAKERSEYAAQIKASAEQNISNALAADASTAVIEHQDVIAAFIASRDFKAETGKVRAILIEYEKFKATRE